MLPLLHFPRRGARRSISFDVQKYAALHIRTEVVDDNRGYGDHIDFHKRCIVNTQLSEPMGIRNNNPGNLREAYGSSEPVKRVGGFAIAPDMVTGLEWLAKLTFDYYTHLDMKTPSEFIMRYAPQNENNVPLYINDVCSYARIGMASQRTWDLRLNRPGRAFDWMMAIVHRENGAVPESWRWWPYWVSPADLIVAMRQAGKWLM